MAAAAEAHDPGFAHPVEREVARLLDEAGIPWQYEPHTFVLQSDARGRPLEAFTPDFFLPEQQLYIECTVMRPSLTRRKRRKIERARALYGIAVEGLFREDLVRLARRWRLEPLARTLRACIDGQVSASAAPGIASSWASRERCRP